MIAFIEEHRNDLGVEPICKVLPIAQSTFHAHAAIARDPDLASDRAKRDAVLSPEIKRVWEEKMKSTASERSGINYNVRSSLSPAAPWPG
jgi:putative transposase